jgi:hypothetical protein
MRQKSVCMHVNTMVLINGYDSIEDTLRTHAYIYTYTTVKTVTTTLPRLDVVYFDRNTKSVVKRRKKKKG